MRRRRGRGRGRGSRAFIRIVLLILIAGAVFSARSGSTGNGSSAGGGSGSGYKADVGSGSGYKAGAGSGSRSSLSFDLSAVPVWSGSPAVAVNDNRPYFTEEELSTDSYAEYGDLDSLGRCTGAVACIGRDLMPTEARGEIGAVRPTGWHLVKYDGIEGNYLYNRCHLIAYELSGENANEKNLITGTRYLNTDGMLPYENMVADYVRSTGSHVLYRVTPVFEGDNLLASGVLMEGQSAEDDGICFCVYVYNVQPGITIDYADGDSSGPEYTVSDTEEFSAAAGQGAAQTPAEAGDEVTYVVNTNTGKFHYPACSSVKDIADHNRLDFTGSRAELIAQNYQPCKRCNP